MWKMVWLDTAVVIMFVMVAILASFFQAGISKGGGTIEDLAGQSSWKRFRTMLLCPLLYPQTKPGIWPGCGFFIL